MVAECFEKSQKISVGQLFATELCVVKVDNVYSSTTGQITVIPFGYIPETRDTSDGVKESFGGGITVTTDFSTSGGDGAYITICRDEDDPGSPMVLPTPELPIVFRRPDWIQEPEPVTEQPDEYGYIGLCSAVRLVFPYLPKIPYEALCEIRVPYPGFVEQRK